MGGQESVRSLCLGATLTAYSERSISVAYQIENVEVRSEAQAVAVKSSKWLLWARGSTIL